MIKFEPKVSIDGVAIILASIAAAIYMGRLDAQVVELKNDNIQQKVEIRRLNDSQLEITKNLAIVATQISDILSKK